MQSPSWNSTHRSKAQINTENKIVAFAENFSVFYAAMSAWSVCKNAVRFFSSSKSFLTFKLRAANRRENRSIIIITIVPFIGAMTELQNGNYYGFVMLFRLAVAGARYANTRYLRG